MSKNIFDVTNDVNNNIQRHSFDWQHQNSFTAKFGYLYPLFSSLVPANFKFDCDANLGLQFMPMIFPVQTRMKARMSFFKVPLRTLWKDYQDYVSNFRTDLEEPYHDIRDVDFKKFYGECQLGDYLDIPNVIYRDGGTASKFKVSQYLNQTSKALMRNGCLNSDGTFNLSNASVGSKIISNFSGLNNPDNFTIQRCINYSFDSSSTYLIPGNRYRIDLTGLPTKMQIGSGVSASTGAISSSFDCKIIFTSYTNNENFVRHVVDYSLDNSPIFSGERIGNSAGQGYKNIVWNSNLEFELPKGNYNINSIYIILEQKYDWSSAQYPSAVTMNNLITWQTDLSSSFDGFEAQQLSILPYEVIESSYEVISKESSPYYSSDSNPDGIKLACYRARAYEAVYNAYYRDIRNNPFYVDGQLTYNRWLPTYEGGADRYPYQLHRANWEKDFLTTAVRSPQQGKAPLVGLSSYITQDPSTDGSGVKFNMALVDENNVKYRVNFSTEDSGMGYAQVQVAEMLDENTPVQSINYTQLINAQQSGFSIPDLRIVNAYQKFLELNMRKGYSYKDIIEGRFDCKVRYDELLMPEFIGGFTRDIQMNRVVQSTDSNYLIDPDGSTSSPYKGTLGSLAGDAFLSTNGNTPHIHCFCDEESIIIGILSIVPMAAYSQLLPKDYLYRDLLDHFQPEFNNLGYQPIKYGEVCPLQLKEFSKKPEDTFGYQRPWYEYVSKPDTVHGLIRSQLRNFVLNRNFVTPPELTKSFLLVDPEQLNDVFAVTEDTDKIIGQCYFDIKVEAPINRVAIPRLD